MALDVTLSRTNKTFQEQMQDLLSKKDKLVKQDVGDGRNKYQVEVNNLKKKIKEYNKSQAKKDGVPKVKFGSLLRNIQKDEKEGKFDRGAEGKAKNAMRKKMAQAKDSSRDGGVHAGTQKDRANKLAQAANDDPEYKAMMKKKKLKTGPGGR
jgi:hypothetical protein|tara:strand:- start:41 stop:496 length:456 start_codon:yes stop_codon:yes gene_type:complete